MITPVFLSAQPPSSDVPAPKPADDNGASLVPLDQVIQGESPAKIETLDQALALIEQMRGQMGKLQTDEKQNETQLNEARKKRQFEVECARYPNRTHIYLPDDSYYNIKRDDAANMLGYFTGRLQFDGFPWELQQELKIGPFKVTKGISEMNALRKLEAGEEIWLQPKRVITLNLNPDNVGAMLLLATPAGAAAGAAGAAAGTATAATAATALNKSVGAKVEGAGREINYGKPVPIHSYGELKLLYDMYSPDSKATPTNELADISKKIAFFAMKMHNTAYPFTFYKDAPKSRISNTLKSGWKGLAAGAAVGALGGLLLSAPAVKTALGFHLGPLTTAFWGGILTGTYRAVKEACSPEIREQINAFDAVDRIGKGQPMIIQRQKLHSVSLLIFGKLTYFTDYRQGSEISSKDELTTYYKMQNQWPDPPPQPPNPNPTPTPTPTPAPAGPPVVAADGSTPPPNTVVGPTPFVPLIAVPPKII